MSGVSGVELGDFGESFDLVPDGFVHGNAAKEVVVAEAKGLFAGVAWGRGGVGAGGRGGGLR